MAWNHHLDLFVVLSHVNFSLRQVPQKDVKENPEVIGEFGGIETEVKTDFATRVWVIKGSRIFHHLNW